MKKFFVQLIFCIFIRLSLQSDLTQIKEDYTLVENWPSPSKKLGAVSGVALDADKNVVVLHRADRILNAESFNAKNVFQQQSLGPISENTIITFDRETGSIISEWGKNLFYMPHGLHINGNHFYITDIALHQVFRFNIKNSKTTADLTLGERFKPGRFYRQLSCCDFCKPTSVVSLKDGDFVVADECYEIFRLTKYSFNGEKLGMEQTEPFIPKSVVPPPVFPGRALTLVAEKDVYCYTGIGVVVCLRAYFTYHSQYHNPIVGNKIMSVDYANNTLFVVNGLEPNVSEVAGYGFDMTTGEVTIKFGSFLNPHDLAVTPDGKEIYVGDLSENHGRRLYKFIWNRVEPKIMYKFVIIDHPVSKQQMRRGETALIVGSIGITVVIRLVAHQRL